MAARSVPSACLFIVMLLGAATGSSAQTAPATTPGAGDVAEGRELYTKMTCHYCHGTEGQGSLAGIGPRLARIPRSLESFIGYVRQPAGRMTSYSETILSDRALADMYAFLRSLPAARSVDEIPLLQQLRRK